MPRISKCSLKRWNFHRDYSQLPRISFTNITEDNDQAPRINDTYATPHLDSNTISSSMSRIRIPVQKLKQTTLSKDKKIMDFSQIPSWYDRLKNASTYTISDDLNHISFEPYRSFHKCYAKVLTQYTDTNISLSRRKMNFLLEKHPLKDIPIHIQEQQIKIDQAVKKLSALSENTFVLYNRLRVRRKTPTFYLHQRILIHLGDRNLPKLLDAYFELPEPRSLHLNREEFEKFMRILLNLKISGDYKPLLPRIIDVYNDIIETNQLHLTPFESTKYLSILLNHWKNINIPQDEKFSRIMSFKLKFADKIKFCPAMWDILLTHFPEKCDNIMTIMADESGLTRLTAEVFLKHLNSHDELNNALELMKLKNFHLDTYLLDTIIDQFIRFNKPQEAFTILSQILHKFGDISQINWPFETQSSQRTKLFKIDVLDKALQQLKNELPNNNFTWLRYKFKPSPLVTSKLLSYLNTKKEDQYQLLKLMVDQKIPLVNKYAIELLQTFDFKSSYLVLQLVNSSVAFNKNLHAVSHDANYDTKYLSNFVYDTTGILNELREIVKISLKIYDAHAGDEDANDLRVSLAEQIVKLNEQIKIM